MEPIQGKGETRESRKPGESERLRWDEQTYLLAWPKYSSTFASLTIISSKGCINLGSGPGPGTRFSA
jgi:hypothetical protein